MPATQGSRTLSTGPVPTNSSAIDHASICINSIGNRDGVKSTRARRCARENGFVGRRSPRPRIGTTFRPVHCDHSGEPGAVRACGRELRALQISGRVVSGERARLLMLRALPCGGDSVRLVSLGQRRTELGFRGGWRPTCGSWTRLARSVARFPRGGRTCETGRHAHPSWDMQDACGPPFAFGASIRFWSLHSLLEPRAHLESCGTERGRGEYLSACNLQR